jgi:hypothetical protein
MSAHHMLGEAISSQCAVSEYTDRVTPNTIFRFQARDKSSARIFIQQEWKYVPQTGIDYTRIRNQFLGSFTLH